MGITNIAGISADANEGRVEATNGSIRQRTIELGETIVSVDNIGSMTLIDGTRNHSSTGLGAAICMGGLMTMHWLGLATSYVLVFAGLLMVAWSLLRPTNKYLSIGTSDGRRTHLVSTSRKSLLATRNFIREKIDTHDPKVATIINGGIAIGAQAQAGGAGSVISNG